MPLDPPPPTHPFTPHSIPAPLVRRFLHHDVWKGPLSDNMTPPSPLKRLATGLFAVTYQFAHAMEQVAQAERLLTQFLSSRSKQYVCT